MSQERTEKATPKRREDARRKGQIARGAELPAALGFLGALLAFSFVSPAFSTTLGTYFQTTSARIAAIKDFGAADTQTLFVDASIVLAVVAVPLLIVALAASLAGNFVQGGFSLTAEALKPKGEKFSPAKNIKKIFGIDPLVNLAKSLVKLVLLSAISYGVLLPLFENSSVLLNAPPDKIGATLLDTIYRLAFRFGFVSLAMALADYGYAYYKNEKAMRMTKQEIREEFKESEGDPLVKSHRRRAARAFAQRRSMVNVPTASVVITNPTHFAVALRYDREKDAAPTVVAKGADKAAAKIRKIALENSIPLVENKPLARALYKIVEPDQVIPAEFFGAVAEILAFVFRQPAGRT